MKLFQKKILFIVTLVMIFGLSLIPSSAASKVNVAIDGNPITISSDLGTPYIDSSNRTIVPIRVISENLGAKVQWDQASSTATINGTIKVKVGSEAIDTSYGKITMDTKAVLKDGRVYVPFRFVGNALGYDVDATTKDGTITANITTKVDLTVSAAASLKSALNEVQAMYQKEKPNSKIAITYGGSGTLQQQIEQGAPVDLFFSAATKNMNALKDKDLLDNNTIKNLLQNKLVMVVPKDSKAKISSFSDITSSGIKKLALGEPKTVPAGEYARQTFDYFKLSDDAIVKNAVLAKDVTEVLTWVAGGNADAGVVYSTDAKTSDKVTVVATAPDAAHDPINYPAAVVKATKHPVATNDFLNFLTSDVAKAVFVKYGFTAL